jgi:hypothetical protein
LKSSIFYVKRLIQILPIAIQDNLGGPDSFSPICAFNDMYFPHYESRINDDGSEEVIETAAFKMDFVFVTQKSWSEPQFLGRRLTCKGQNKLEKCCAANAFSGLDDDGIEKRQKWCKKKGCEEDECPVNYGRRKLSGEVGDSRIVNHLRSPKPLTERLMIEDDLTGIEFNDAIEQFTDYEPISTGAVLDATNLKDVAECRASNYNATEYNTPTLECGEYNESSCADNDYVVVESNSTDANETDYCLPDDFYCNDNDKCTVDSWDSNSLSCNNAPVTCSSNQSCDPVDG